MVGVHVRHDVRLGRREGLSSLYRQQQIGGIQIDNAPKTADEMRLLGLQRVKCEISKVGISRSRRVARKKARPSGGALRRPHVTDQGDARASHWIAGIARPINKQGRPRIVLEVLRMKRQPRDEEDGGAIRLRCGQNQRGVGVSGAFVNGRQSPLERRSNKCPGVGCNLPNLRESGTFPLIVNSHTSWSLYRALNYSDNVQVKITKLASPQLIHLGAIQRGREIFCRRVGK